MSGTEDDSQLSVSTRALRTLSENLRADAEVFQDKAAHVTDEMLRGAVGDRAYGADSRNVPAAQAITFYTEVSDNAGKFMSDVGSGLLNMSRCVSAIAGSLGERDDENAERVRRVLELDKDSPSGGSQEA